MALFGGASLMPTVAAGVRIVPTYAVEKDKDTGKTVKDKDGDPVLKLNPATGKPIITAETIKLAARVSTVKDEDGKTKKGADGKAILTPDCLQSITGLKGQQLMGFEREARGALAQGRLGEFTKLIASGTYTFGTAVNRANGTKSFVIKPIFGGKSIAGADDNELLEELKRRGISVEVQPGAPATNGHAEPATDEGAKNTPPTPEAPAAAKPRETAAERKASKLAEAAK